MEDNNLEQNQDVEIIKEKMKERPISRKKLLRRTMITAAMAVIFGLIACFTFLVLEPVFSNMLYPEEEPIQVQLQEEGINEEMRPEDMLLEEETEEETEEVQSSTTVIEKVELEVSDYQKLHRKMYALAQETTKSLVTVTGVSSDVDWFDNTFESKGQTAGIIVADNGKELLVLADYAALSEAEQLQVSFFDESVATASLKQVDAHTGLAVFSILREEIPKETFSQIKIIELGGSGKNLMGSAVIAIGSPLGSGSSVIYGMITSSGNMESLVDGSYRLLTTDMYGASNASGALINLSGQVVGIVCNSAQKKDKLITAYGISDLKKVIEKLSNGQEIAELGVYGTDVTNEAYYNLNVPKGAYVTGIKMDSPAMEAGIQSGDVIVQIGDASTNTIAGLHDAVLKCTPDTRVSVTLMRQGPESYQEMIVEVTLGRAE